MLSTHYMHDVPYSVHSETILNRNHKIDEKVQSTAYALRINWNSRPTQTKIGLRRDFVIQRHEPLGIRNQSNERRKKRVIEYLNWGGIRQMWTSCVLEIKKKNGLENKLSWNTTALWCCVALLMTTSFKTHFFLFQP